ncbi:hypothetical protein TNCV_2508001 [Trichonephila clavipes]|nr:hypothetical protein TNCV_2508001 [Trichonephila clavipes]
MTLIDLVVGRWRHDRSEGFAFSFQSGSQMSGIEAATYGSEAKQTGSTMQRHTGQDGSSKVLLATVEKYLRSSRSHSCMSVRPTTDLLERIPLLRNFQATVDSQTLVPIATHSSRETEKL